MKTVIRTSSHELSALLLYTLDWHQQERHNADIETCADPICALANAIAGVDPEAGTFLPGNHAITITVETGETGKVMDFATGTGAYFTPENIQHIIGNPPYESDNGGDGAEVQAELAELVAQGRIITDGHVYWSKRCPVCKQMTMYVVRPGQVQCSEGCGHG